MTMTIAADDPLNDPEQRAVLDAILEEDKDKPGATMMVLNRVQQALGYLSLPVQHYIAENLRVPVGHVYGVVSFYSFFTMQPRGRHQVRFCLGTACYVRGNFQNLEKAEQELAIKTGQTTPDRRYTLEVCRCVGACSQAPVVMINDDIHGRLRATRVPAVLRKYE